MYCEALVTSKENVVSVLATKAYEFYGESFEETKAYFSKKWNAVIATYPNNVPVRYCTRCHMPLTYNSMAYVEGYHFDTCL